MVTLLVLFVLLAPGMAPALKTNQVEFGKDGTYDGHVTISRDVSGNMVFKDDSLTSPIALATIAHGVRNHGELTGLGSDDHTQYLNTGRHGTVHTAAFNNNLPIGPDVMNNTTIGQHVQDSDIHISRSLGEMIVGPWKFDVLQEFRGNIKLSQHGLPGKMDIYFEDGESDAHLRWNKLYDRFEFNRMLYTPEANFDSATVTTLRTGENLYGNRPNYPPSGRISNFVSIEGIASENLLDKSADEDISGKWDFLNDVYIDGDLVTSGTITSLGGIKGLSKENVITVAKKGGDYETVQEAVNAATEGTTILVYPGTYEEQVNITSKDYISIVGTSLYQCVIKFNPPGTFYQNATVIFYSSNYCSIENISIINPYDSGADSETALSFRYSTNCFAENCIIKSGGRDTVGFAPGASNCCLDSCEVWGDFDIIYFFTSGMVQDCIIKQNSGSGLGGAFIWIGTGGSIDNIIVYLYGNTCISSTGNSDAYLKVEDANSYTVTIYTTGEKFGGAWPFYEYCGSTSQTPTICHGMNLVGSAIFYWGNTLDVNLYRGSANVLKTDDAFDANSIKIGGTERIDSSGNVKGTTLLSGGNTVADASGGLASYTTLWKDFPACQGQNAHSANMEGHTHPPIYADTVDVSEIPIYASTDGNSWHPAAGNDVTYMHCTVDGECRLYDIPYEAGTVLTRLRVKWQADGVNDGVKVRLVKRDESGTVTGWTVVGSQQTYKDTGVPWDVTVSTYDFQDETMAANYSYSIEVESEVVMTGVNLFAVGIESSKRVY